MPPVSAVPAGLAPGLEAASVVLFVWAWRETRRGTLITCAVYGWVLEAANLAIFRSYHYPADLYALRLGDVPLYIPLLWAVILHSSMAITDRRRLARWARPFADGLLALVIDLAIDAIAIRLGLWRWRIPSEGFRFMRFDEGWFGVPPGNLMAWMWVAASYSYFRRGLAAGERERRNSNIQNSGSKVWRDLANEAAVVALSYAGLFAGMAVSGLARRAAGIPEADQTARLWLFGGQVLLFVALVCAGRRPRPAAEQQPETENPRPETGDRKPDAGDPTTLPRSFVAGRWAMHVSFAVLLVATGAWRDAPALLAVSAATMLAEGLVARRKGK